MSKVFASPGVCSRPFTREEDEVLNRWKYLQMYSRAMVSAALRLEATEPGDPRSGQALTDLVAAARGFRRLGGRAEDVRTS